MQYSKIINDQRVIFSGVLVVDDRQVINPVLATTCRTTTTDRARPKRGA